MSAFRHDTPAKPRVARVPKARIEPWVYTDRSGLSSVGAALSARAFGLCRCGSWLCIRWESAAPVGSSINVWKQLTQGLRPGLCRRIALAGLFQFLIPNPNPFPCTNISEPTNARRPQSNPTITLPTTNRAQIHLSLYITWGWVSPLGRYSCKAQGGESAKGTNRTLGIYSKTKNELRRSDTHSKRLVCGFAVRGFAFVGVVPPLQAHRRQI